jgi:sulfate transporter 4
MGMTFIFVLLAYKYLSGAYKKLFFLKALGPLTVCVISIALMNIFNWYEPSDKPLIKPIGSIPSGEPARLRQAGACIPADASGPHSHNP